MGRTAKNRDLPHLPPVEKVELSSKHLVPRIVAAALLLLIGAGALAYAFSTLFSGEPGWQEIKVSSRNELTCGSDFVFTYNIGAGGASASSESRAVTALYTQAATHAYRVFDTVQSWDGVGNLYDVNRHPNEIVEVDPALYRAFALLEEHRSRALYLGPVYAVYQSLFYCQDDNEAAAFDPLSNDSMAAYVAEGAAYARDPAAVELELLGENRVRLNVSEDYLAWAEYNETDRFLDFFWLKNAFVADYLADTLTEGGYTLGALSSYDGYVRTLDGSGASYSLGLFDRGDAIFQAGVLNYTGPASLVTLRAYPTGGETLSHYYQWENGDIRSPFVDLADGLCRTSLPQLTCWSKTAGCAEIALRMAPLYVAEEFSPAGAEELAGSEIWSVWCRDRVIHSNGPDAAVTDLYSDNGVTYTLDRQ